MRHSFFTFLICLIFISCSNKKSIEDCSLKNYPNKVIVSKKIKIPINETISFNTSYNFYSDSILVREDKMQSKYDFFDLGNQKHLQSLSFNSEGPNSVQRFGATGILPVDNGEDFIFGSLQGKIYHIKGDTINKVINLNDFNLLGINYSLYSINKTKPVLIDDAIFYYNVPQIVQADRDLFYKEPIFLKYNYKDSNLEKNLNVSYPEHYKTGFWNSLGHIHPGFTYTPFKNQIIFSFPILHELYAYNIVENKMEVINKCLKSKYFAGTIEPLKNGSTSLSFLEMNQLMKMQATYEAIEFNKFEKIYYRIISLPVENDQDLTSQDRYNLVVPFVVMILNSNFEILAELKVEGKNYDYRDFFINEEGLWISNNNPLNPEFDENFLSYTLFELK